MTLLAPARGEQGEDAEHGRRRRHADRERLRAREAPRANGRGQQLERSYAAAGSDGERQLQRPAMLGGEAVELLRRARRPGGLRHRRAELGQRTGAGRLRRGDVARDPHGIAAAPAKREQRALDLFGHERVVGAGQASAQHQRVADHQQQVGGAPRAMHPRHVGAARHARQRWQIVRRDRERQRPQPRLFGQAKRSFDHAPVGGGDQHTLLRARGPVGGGLAGQQREVVRRVVRRERQMPLELEADHLPDVAGHGRELDRLDGDGAAR